MRYVVVPDSVIPKQLNGKPYTEKVDGADKALDPITLHGYLMRYVINEASAVVDGAAPRVVPKMGPGYQGTKNIRKLDRLFEKSKPLDIVPIEDADWDRVKRIIDEMSFTPPHFGAELETIADAWMKAYESQTDAETAVKQLREKLVTEKKSA